MLDKDSIAAIQEAEATKEVCAAVDSAMADHGVVALPKSFNTVDLEKYLENRRRLSGLMKTYDLEAFTGYVVDNAVDGFSNVFVDADSMSATAVLNFGSFFTPGHADNLAKLVLRSTAEYDALQGILGQRKQTDVAEFLEDWPEQIQCFNEAGEIQRKHAIAAVRKITIESMRKSENSEQVLSASKSVMESVSATSVDPIPTVIYFKCSPYAEIDERIYVIRLNVLTGGPAPALSLRLVTPELHKKEVAKEFDALVERSIKELLDKESERKVHIGIFTGTYQAT